VASDESASASAKFVRGPGTKVGGGAAARPTTPDDADSVAALAASSASPTNSIRSGSPLSHAAKRNPDRRMASEWQGGSVSRRRTRTRSGGRAAASAAAAAASAAPGAGAGGSRKTRWTSPLSVCTRRRSVATPPRLSRWEAPAVTRLRAAPPGPARTGSGHRRGPAAPPPPPPPPSPPAPSAAVARSSSASHDRHSTHPSPPTTTPPGPSPPPGAATSVAASAGTGAAPSRTTWFSPRSSS